MTARQIRLLTILTVFYAGPAFAQAPPNAPKEPPPLWDLQLGASFVGTSGNSDTASTGADFAAHRRGEVWKLETTATAVHTSDKGDTTAERYIGAVRVNRALNPTIGLSSGEKAEHDRFAGIDFRNIADVGLSWALVRQTTWTLDGVTGIAWNHESRTVGENLDDPVGLFQVLSRIPFGSSGDTTQRLTIYPDFRTSSAYRTEVELTAQAAMTGHLALKIGYLLRYSNDPVPGFQKTDNTTTASVVFRWKASTPAP